MQASWQAPEGNATSALRRVAGDCAAATARVLD
jgi:hypothetical protein